MSRAKRWMLRIAVGAIALLTVAILAAIFTIRSEWFRAYVQRRIVAEAERVTGGRVEMGRFSFDWTAMQARVDSFVLHGIEEEDQAPLLKLDSLALGLRVISIMERDVDLASLSVSGPRLNLIVYPDGSTNFPGPGRSREDGLWTRDLLNLKIGEYEITDGLLEYDERRIPLNVRGEHLRIRMRYDPSAPAYTGNFHSDGLDLTVAGYRPIETSTDADFTLRENDLEFARLEIGTAASAARLAGTLEDLRNPHGRFNVEGSISVPEAVRTLDLPISPSGAATFNGALDISFVEEVDFGFNGRFAATGLSYVRDQITVKDIDLRSNVSFTQAGLYLTGLRTRVLDAEVAGEASLLGSRQLHVEGDIAGLDLQRAAALIAHRDLPWAATLAGPFLLDLTLGEDDAVAEATFNVAPTGEGIEVAGNMELSVDQAAGRVTVGASSFETPASRLELSGTLGEELRVRLRSTDLDDLLPALAIIQGGGDAGEASTERAAIELPLKLNQGSATLDGIVTGSLTDPTFDGQASIVNGEFRGFRFERFAGDLNASRRQILTRNFLAARGAAEVTGSAALTARPGSEAGGFGDAEMTANLSVHSIELGPLVAEAGWEQEVTGVATAEVRISGSVQRPQTRAELDVLNPAAFGEHLDRARASVSYLPGKLDIVEGVADDGDAEIRFSGNYTHPASDWRTGDASFEAITDGIPASRFERIAQIRPAVDGRLNGSLRGSGRMENGVFSLTATNLDMSARGITVASQPIGDFSVLAETRGRDLSLFAGGTMRESIVEGSGSWRLEGEAPGTASLRFTRMSTDTAHELMMLGAPREAQDLPFEGFIEGGAIINVPLQYPGEFRAEVQLDSVQLNPRPDQALQLGVEPQDLILRNSQPVLVDVTTTEARIRTAEFTGRDTRMTASGTVPLGSGQGANLAVTGNINLIILQLLNPDLLAEGNATVDTTIRGNLQDPDVNGRLELTNASLYLADLPNGVDNAAGAILFDRRRATIETLVAETGGGEIAFTGFLEFGSTLAYRLQAEAHQVRVRYPQDVSTTFNADLALNGTSEVSTLSGTILLSRASFNPRADLGQLLAEALQPAPVPGDSDDYLSGTQFDIRIQNAPAFQVETSLTRDLAAETDLRLRGSPLRPILLGTISINRGEVQVFGNRYSVDRGEIRFLNPVKIEPTLDMDLSTRARGVTVNISFSGPLDRLTVNYSSDPPLQTSEIIALLAVGRDPSQASSQTAPGLSGTSSSGFIETGGSLLGQAISSQVSSRLQRFFGASRVKIDPTLTGVDNLPQARLTLEQQVSRDITLTYITNLNRTTEQLVRVQWDLNQEWSAIAVRDPNGLFGIDFQFRKRFK